MSYNQRFAHSIVRTFSPPPLRQAPCMAQHVDDCSTAYAHVMDPRPQNQVMQPLLARAGQRTLPQPANGDEHIPRKS